MHIETERKFLVRDDRFKALATASHHIRQGYIAHEAGNTVRVRLWDEQGILTIKGRSADGISRPEWEMEIPLQDALDLFPLCPGGDIDKTRYIVPAGNGRKFEVDVFHGDNEGLVMAEVELSAEDEPYVKPDFITQEVTGDRRYYNSQLRQYPYKEWGEKSV